MDPEGEGFGRKLWIQIPLGNVYWIEWSCSLYDRLLVFMKIDREIQIHVFWSISDLYNVCLMIDDGWVFSLLYEQYQWVINCQWTLWL